MKKYRSVLYSKELYTLMKSSNCSFKMLKSDTSLINYIFSFSFLNPCVLLGKKNTLVSLSIDSLKFVEIIISIYTKNF
ncbi:hypothetical protein [uncultured Brachyspira sp.]|uniref:hypothetical protein n=1 Tax=uncultured Brachyspira sp. TaxID=221953 RepID=UPI00258FCCFC|nr:hypothetical protein [uncultured Brachyspira sp.]